MINKIQYNNSFSPKFTSNNEQSNLNKKDNTTTNMLLLGSALLIGGFGLYSHKNLSDKYAKLQDSFTKLSANVKPEKTDLNPIVEQTKKLSDKITEVTNTIRDGSSTLISNQSDIKYKLNNQNEGILSMFTIIAEKLGVDIDKKHAFDMVAIKNVDDLVKILGEVLKA